MTPPPPSFLIFARLLPHRGFPTSDCGSPRIRIRILILHLLARTPPRPSPLSPVPEKPMPPMPMPTPAVPTRALGISDLSVTRAPTRFSRRTPPWIHFLFSSCRLHSRADRPVHDHDRHRVTARSFARSPLRTLSRCLPSPHPLPSPFPCALPLSHRPSFPVELELALALCRRRLRTRTGASPIARDSARVSRWGRSRESPRLRAKCLPAFYARVLSGCSAVPPRRSVEPAVRPVHASALRPPPYPHANPPLPLPFPPPAHVACFSASHSPAVQPAGGRRLRWRVYCNIYCTIWILCIYNTNTYSIIRRVERRRPSRTLASSSFV